MRNGERLLLIRYADRPMVAQYALIAGFTEIGETMEQTVCREEIPESRAPIDLTHTMTELFRLGKDPR